jgi:hypothetical protein
MLEGGTVTRRTWTVAAMVLAVSVGVLAASPEDLVGRWGSGKASYGFTYENGQLVCEKLGTDEVYACRIFGSTLAGTYVLDGVTQTETAEIVLDASGWPVEIHWEHGAIFVRVDSAESVSAFAGTWEGQDVDDDSLTTVVIEKDAGRLTATLFDTYSDTVSGTRVTPGYSGAGAGATMSTSTAQVTFTLAGANGDEHTVIAELTLTATGLEFRYSRWNDVVIDPPGLWATLRRVEKETASGCCFSDGSCEDLSRQECGERGGTRRLIPCARVHCGAQASVVSGSISPSGPGSGTPSGPTVGTISLPPGGLTLLPDLTIEIKSALVWGSFGNYGCLVTVVVRNEGVGDLVQGSDIAVTVWPDNGCESFENVDLDPLKAGQSRELPISVPLDKSCWSAYGMSASWRVGAQVNWMSPAVESDYSNNQDYGDFH